jgi:flotillin
VLAEAEAEAKRKRALAEADATEQTGRAQAAALQAMKEAEAAGKKAEAESVKASLLAEAEGRRELAAASAAEGEINLRQYIVEQLTKADVAKAEAIATALAGLGGNVRIVQFAGGNGNGSNGATGHTLLDMLLSVPEVAEVMKAKVEALSGDTLENAMTKFVQLFNSLRQIDQPGSAPAQQLSALPILPSDDGEEA